MQISVPRQQIRMGDVVIDKSIEFAFEPAEVLTLDRYAGMGAIAIQLAGNGECDLQELQAAQQAVSGIGVLASIPEVHNDEPITAVIGVEDVLTLRTLVERGTLVDCAIKGTPLSQLRTGTNAFPAEAIAVYRGLDVAAAYATLSPAEMLRNCLRFNRNPRNPEIIRMSQVRRPLTQLLSRTLATEG